MAIGSPLISIGRAVGRFENPGVPVLFEIGLTEFKFPAKIEMAFSQMLAIRL